MPFRLHVIFDRSEILRLRAKPFAQDDSTYRGLRYGEIGGKCIVRYSQGSPLGRAPAIAGERADVALSVKSPLRRASVRCKTPIPYRPVGTGVPDCPFERFLQTFGNEALSVSLRLPPPPKGEAFCTVRAVKNASPHIICPPPSPVPRRGSRSLPVSAPCGFRLRGASHAYRRRCRCDR